MFFHFIKTINLISGLFLILLTARLAAYYSRFQLCLHFDIVLSFLDSVWYSFGLLSCLKYLSFQNVILVLGSYYIFRQTQKQFLLQLVGVFRGGSRAAATSNMEYFVIKALHLGCCSSPRSASGFYWKTLENMVINWVMVMSLIPFWCHLRKKTRTFFSKSSGARQLWVSSK